MGFLPGFDATIVPNSTNNSTIRIILEGGIKKIIIPRKRFESICYFLGIPLSTKRLFIAYEDEKFVVIAYKLNGKWCATKVRRDFIYPRV